MGQQRKKPDGLCGSDSCYVALAVLVVVSVFLWPSAAVGDGWDTSLYSQHGSLGTVIGTAALAHDGYDGGGPTIVQPGWVGVFLLAHYVQGDEHGWNGPTGFYADNYETPIPAGGSKTWWNFYLWSQNYTPNPPNEIQVLASYEHSSTRPPIGTMGHLVIDQVATGVTWTGPMDYWFDMSVFNTFAMPIATVTDPLQGTRFHLTVYVPEPSSLAALALGIAGIGVGRIRRKRA